ncbi:MAG: ligase-associated DNA damage response DEXH box helicase [Flavobacteriales bacterium]|nr:ligase-associated DNA damage response DEXH box helicase [Flavobacteriales bacterium]
MSPGEIVIQKWLQTKGRALSDFQQDAMQARLHGKSCLVSVPTGMGKTYSALLPLLAEYINHNPDYKTRSPRCLQVLWITPLKALAKDLRKNIDAVLHELDLPWKTGLRTGDVQAAEKALQKKQMPEILLITPESLHLLFCQKDHAQFFSELSTVVVDEWHDLLGNKRGVQVELAISRLKKLRLDLILWGMSASMGNTSEALDVLVGPTFDAEKKKIITTRMKKRVEVHSILPDRIEKMPWAGHVGIHLCDKVMQVVNQSQSTLLFTNTRAQTEAWYRHIAENYPEMAGLVALHHGALDREIREWVEENLHTGRLKLVICTSSLDLGVDFLPVETVIQVGSPKSMARFLQRAGRSGHQPGAVSRVYFVPTHALELIEAVSLRIGTEENKSENRMPVELAYDTLLQYMVTRALGGGFDSVELFKEIKETWAYQHISEDDWLLLLGLITTGGATLQSYDDFKKVEFEDGRYVVNSRKIAMRHRLSIGTIVSDTSLKIQFQNGKYIGNIEEQFIARLKPGDSFVFAGMFLEFIRVKELTVFVRRGKPGKGNIPRWSGGRMQLSSTLSVYIRKVLSEALKSETTHPELQKIAPLLQLQQEISKVPERDELLIELCKTREGHHVFIYPFEGRAVHEGMASLLAWRISRHMEVSFSMAMNDYGFELLSNRELPTGLFSDAEGIFSADNLLQDIQKSLNANELAKRKFREIAAISGMVFKGYPGQGIKTKHLQASSSLLFDVISEYDPENLLIKQAYNEVLEYQLEEQRLRAVLMRISGQKIRIVTTSKPSPFAFPIMVDRLRDQFSTEKLEDRIQHMLTAYNQ